MWTMYFKFKQAMTLLSLGIILIGCAPQAHNPIDRDGIALAPTPDILRENLARDQRAIGRIIGEGLKDLRIGPGKTFAIKSKVKSDEYVKVLRKSSDANGNKWFLIQTSKGTEGWIAGHLVDIY